MKHKKKIFFSIIIPTFNNVRMLKKAINSVLNQTYKNFEILVMDDGSTDGTKKIIKKIKDSRLKYEWKSNFGGPAWPRNRGIKKSKGNWICFLDSDDIWFKEKLDVLQKQIKISKNIDIFCNNEILVNSKDNKKKILKYGPFKKDFYKYLLINGNVLSTSAVTVKKKFIKKNKVYFRENKDFISVEDYDFWLFLALNGAKFKFLKSILGIYTIHKSNISKRNKMHWDNNKKLLKDHVFNLQKFENKTLLWDYIQTRLNISMALFSFKINFNILSFLVKVLRELILSPFSTIKFFLNKLISKVRLYEYSS